MKESYDVIVVGAGPAGSSTAEVCAKHGLSVLILERNPQIGEPKRCGEGLSHNSVKRLKLNLPQDCIAQTIEGIIVYAPNKKKVVIRFEEEKGYVLERKKFDKWLAANAVKAGAGVVKNARVYDLIKDNGRVAGVKVDIMGDKKEIKSKIVVAADGVESMIARMSGLNTNKTLQLVDSGFQYEMGNIKLEDPHMLEIYVGTKLAPRGYAWIFPKGEKRANVGIGIRPGDRPAKEYLDEFIESRDDMKNAKILEINGGSVPVGGLMKNMVANGLIGVGDAVNQVNALHGGGIAESITAGKIAGEIINKCIKNGDVSANVLSEYNKIWWKERGDHLAKVEKVREAFEKMNDQNMNNLADVLSGEDLVDLARGRNIIKLSKILLKYKMKNLSDMLGF